MLNNVIKMFCTDLSSSCLLKQLAALQTKCAYVCENCVVFGTTMYINFNLSLKVF